jgi:putative transposase
MPEYRRLHIQGATVFITFVTFGRSPIFLRPEARRILHDVWHAVANRNPFTTEAICILPDHIHTIIALPDCDSDFSLRVREIKRLFTINYLRIFDEEYQRSLSRIRKKEATVWQRRFWEHTIRDENDYQNHFDYIHYNPVKHSLVNNVSDWPYSSFHRYVRSGVYDSHWGEGLIVKKDHIDYGE